MKLKYETLTNRDYHRRPELGATTLKSLEREGPEYVELAKKRIGEAEERYGMPLFAMESK